MLQGYFLIYKMENITSKHLYSKGFVLYDKAMDTNDKP